MQEAGSCLLVGAAHPTSFLRDAESVSEAVRSCGACGPSYPPGDVMGTQEGLPGKEPSSNTLCVCAHTLGGTLKLFRCLGRKQRNKALLLGCLGVKKPSF